MSISTAPVSPGGSYDGARSLRATPSLSRSDIILTLSLDEGRLESLSRAGSTAGSTKKRLSTPRWLGHVRSWLSVSEPSAQAMKAQKRMAYKRYGVGLNDPQAAAKMHLPIGKVPGGITTSTRGPSPEKALRERARENMASYVDVRSISSGTSSVTSFKRINEVTPWD
ncbi:hypothetical protein G6O67_002477 [Ophiocordyceps sinensis]|uniref:Uncharacterized protein n=2 Tax=Ophiocordyceps sinensis TaxID=72228 RepID=A0A8H4PUI0_9HYPO|nr:hypothetical protein OCS_05803 [Ophiocordyceps sinensis CO18]KAF4510601.1 hypothetical protein G6O67_002477 [Ophiocordyceps sinensis]